MLREFRNNLQGDVMDALLLARLQFAATTVYHFFFVPLTIGLAFLIAIMETIYVRTGNLMWKRMTQFWGKLFLINFAMGVVTGIVQEFQFGMNWSEYSRFVGDVFGAPLAIEALLAFFLESVFLGIWLFGWEKLSPKLHCLTIWLVSLGTSISAYWILVAASFMHHPPPLQIVDGRPAMQNWTDFFHLAFNTHVSLQFHHVWFSALCTGAFFILGISSWHLLKKDSLDVEFFENSFKVGLFASIFSLLGVMVVGHLQAQFMVRVQPMKMAAAEGLWESADPAPLGIVSLSDETNQREIFSLKIPAALSFLAYNSFSGEVKGIKELQKMYTEQFGPDNYIPPVNFLFYSFRVMAGAGVAMFGLAVLGVFFMLRNRLMENTLLLKVFIFAIILPYIANTTGWLLTEVGRQPWVVYGLLKTADGLSPNVGSGALLFSLASFVLVYGILMAVDVWLLAKFAKKGPGDDSASTNPFAL